MLSGQRLSGVIVTFPASPDPPTPQRLTALPQTRPGPPAATCRRVPLGKTTLFPVVTPLKPLQAAMSPQMCPPLPNSCPRSSDATTTSPRGHAQLFTAASQSLPAPLNLEAGPSHPPLVDRLNRASIRRWRGPSDQWEAAPPLAAACAAERAGAGAGAGAGRAAAPAPWRPRPRPRGGPRCSAASPTTRTARKRGGSRGARGEATAARRWPGGAGRLGAGPALRE